MKPTESPFKTHTAQNPSETTEFALFATIAAVALALGLFNAYYNYKNAQTSQANNLILLRLQGGQ